MFTIEQVNKLVSSITKAQAKAVKDIGSLLLMAVWFATEQKDAGAANALVKCLTKSTAKAGLCAFLEQNANLVYANGTFAYYESETVREWPTTKEGIAKLRMECTNWETFKVAKPVEVLDIEEKLAAIVTAAAKAQKGKREVLHASLLEGIAQLLGAYHAKEFDGK